MTRRQVSPHSEMKDSHFTAQPQDGGRCIHHWRKTDLVVRDGKRAMNCMHCGIWMARTGNHFWYTQMKLTPSVNGRKRKPTTINVQWRMSEVRRPA